MSEVKNINEEDLQKVSGGAVLSSDTPMYHYYVYYLDEKNVERSISLYGSLRKSAVESEGPERQAEYFGNHPEYTFLRAEIIYQ